MDVELNQHFACMFAIFVFWFFEKKLVIVCFKQSCTGQLCHLKSEEKRERGGLDMALLPPPPLVSLSMPSIRGLRASGSDKFDPVKYLSNI